MDLKAETREPTIGDELERASGLTSTAIGTIVTRAREPTPTARTRDQPRNQDLTHACKQACEHTLTQHSRYAHNPMYNHMGHTRNHARQQSKNRANTQTHTNTPTHTNTQTRLHQVEAERVYTFGAWFASLRERVFLDSPALLKM